VRRGFAGKGKEEGKYRVNIGAKLGTRQNASPRQVYKSSLREKAWFKDSGKTRDSREVTFGDGKYWK
jgi:hypothetical protein